MKRRAAPVAISNNQFCNFTCPECRQRLLMQVEAPWLDDGWVWGRLECPSPICGERFTIRVQAPYWKGPTPPTRKPTRR